MAEVKAQLNNLRLAPRKVRAVVNLIKGKKAVDAVGQLPFLIKRPSIPLSKLIQSALANAENNFQMVRDNLFIKELRVDEGVKLKRFRPKAYGRVGPIQKKTSRITLILAEKVPGLKRKVETKSTEQEAKAAHKHEHHEHKEPEIKTKIGTEKVKKPNIVRRIFQRKAI